jgi:diguanylate cyclase (GGDEF)-like protein/PAS domain S-box-containing protein
MRPDTSLKTGLSWLRAMAQGSTLLCVMMIALVWLGVRFHLQVEYNDAERGAVQNSANLARAFEEHLSRTLNEIDRSLKIIRSSYLFDQHQFDLRRWLSVSQMFDDHTLQVAIISPEGFIKLSSLESPSAVGTDLRDREHFQRFIDAHDDELFISKPVVGRTTGKWSLQLARRITNPDGSFAGVIDASLDPSYLSRFYSSVDVGSEGYIRIVGFDGIIRAVGGHSPEALGTDLTRGDLFMNTPKQPSGWYYTDSTFTDHIHRLVTYRTLKDYPFIVTIGLSTAEVFSAVYAKQQWYNLIAIALTLLILAVNGFSVRGRFLRERMAEALKLQNLRLNALLKDMPLGVSMFDKSGRLTISNHRYFQMYRLPDGAIPPGTPLRAIVERKQARGTFSGDVEAFCNQLASQLGQGLLVRGQAHLDDGRVIESLSQPMEDGGWVSIHEDITEQQLAKARLEQTRKFLDTIFENVPAPIVVKDAATHKIVLVNHAYEQLVGAWRESLIGSTPTELFPSEQAELISRLDADDGAHGNKRLSTEFSLQTPAKGQRLITTTSLVVRDETERPSYLITVIDDITERKKAEERISYLAHHDALTSLVNRARFAELLDSQLASASSEKLAVLFLDLDRFKYVNDTMGHLIGDELLKTVADRLRSCLCDGDTVARLGGDEFAIICARLQDKEAVATVAEKICTAIKEPYDLGGIQAVVDVSIGISCAEDGAPGSAELMKQADVALYRAKADGRGVYRFFEPEMVSRIEAQRNLEADLRRGLMKGQFELFYQPVVNIEDSAIVGLESLLRWRHPERGLVSPAEFIPVAEETGLIVALGEWVLRQACADAAKWPSQIKIAVNLSPAQFRSQDLAQVVINALASSGVSPSRLELEITEEILLGHDRQNLEVLRRLRDLGIQIVMDDFGIGYSSLNYLRLFPFDRIKIDRSFVNDLSSGDDLSFAIVQAVTRLARALDIPSTAEGIETEEQLELVRSAGCTEFQGFLFSKPRPAAEISRLLQLSAQGAVKAAVSAA